MTDHMREIVDAGYDAPNAKGAAPTSNPPSYDYATGGQSSMNGKAQAPSSASLKHRHSPSYSPPSAEPPRTSGGGNLFHYQHPATGHLISTPLPPDHPEMICLQEGQHVRTSRFGILGVLAAVFWFPLGIGLCLLDRRVVCRRCGRVIDDGLSC